MTKITMKNERLYIELLTGPYAGCKGYITHDDGQSYTVLVYHDTKPIRTIVAYDHIKPIKPRI